MNYLHQTTQLNAETCIEKVKSLLKKMAKEEEEGVGVVEDGGAETDDSQKNKNMVGGVKAAVAKAAKSGLGSLVGVPSCAALAATSFKAAKGLGLAFSDPVGAVQAAVAAAAKVNTAAAAANTAANPAAGASPLSEAAGGAGGGDEVSGAGGGGGGVGVGKLGLVAVGNKLTELQTEAKEKALKHAKMDKAGIKFNVDAADGGGDGDVDDEATAAALVGVTLNAEEVGLVGWLVGKLVGKLVGWLVG
jgi:hypothetical protein